MANSDDDAKTLATLRERIRETDRQLLALVAERITVARAIGERKRALGLPVKDFQVEKEVAQRNQATARDLGLDERLADEMTRLLIGHAVQAQDALGSAVPARQAAGRKVLVVGGRGGMGGWLIDFFASFGHAPTAHDRADDEVASDALERAAATADVVVLSTPIPATAGLLTRLAAAGCKALVFDICSLKSPLIAAIAAARARGLRVASLHPMFGPGVRQLAGRNLIVCDCGDTAAAAEAAAFFASTPARLTTMPLAEHDELMGLVLGLSHLTSLSFAEALRRSGKPLRKLAQVASTTFTAQLGVTVPVSSEHQDLYYEIQAENVETPQVIAAFAAALEDYRAAIASQDRAAFKAMMESGRRYLKGEA